MSASSADPTSPLSPAQKASRRASLELLQAGRYADLDARMNGFQQAYRARALGDLDLLREFAAFARTDSILRANLDAWVTGYPDSYAARLARGIYYFKCGVVTRGKKYIDRTTAAQIRGMEVYLTQARGDLLKSLPLDAQPLISYHYLLVIGMEFGERESAREWLDKGTALDPDSIVIRRPYMISLETRWGGSLDAMLKFLDASRQAGASPDHLKMLDELTDRERRWLHKKPTESAAAESEDPS
jgi:tetratricopeptide (TPR) repeat protein